MRDIPPGALTPEILSAEELHRPPGQISEILQPTNHPLHRVGRYVYPSTTHRAATLVPVNVPQSLSFRQNLF